MVKGVLGKLSLLLFDGKLDEEEHHRLQRHNWDISGALVGDVLMEQSQGGGSLADSDEFVSPLENILRLLVRRRRLSKDFKSTSKAHLVWRRGKVRIER